jgi:single-strand selective monofunctional uracil DNA glycosylase
MKATGRKAPQAKTEAKVQEICAPRSVCGQLIDAALRLRDAVDRLKFSAPVTHVYNPLRYAWAPHEQYLRRFAASRPRIVFIGMNPGPFGMVQTGIPFGEIAAVRDWLGITGDVLKPVKEHPKRVVSGFDCRRSEVSGFRLWGLFAKRFGTAAAFFENHLVLNYCPLAFLESTGRNRTPDKLRPMEKEALFRACDRHLRDALLALQPEWLVGIGGFAAQRVGETVAELISPTLSFKTCQILHPSPANPAANRDWPNIVTRQLCEAGVWNQ